VSVEGFVVLCATIGLVLYIIIDLWIGDEEGDYFGVGR